MSTASVKRASALVAGAGVGVLLLALIALLAWPMQALNPPSSGDYDAVTIHPHDFRAFTQGLDYDDGQLYESTGRHGASSLRRVHVGTGVVLQKHNLDDEYFGEGLALAEDRAIQLTWRSEVGFV